MRRVSTVGTFLLLAILVTPAIFADEPIPGTEPPQARIGPPTGVTSSADEPPSIFALFMAWLQARIGPPTG